MWSHTNEKIFDHWKWFTIGFVRPVDESSMLMRRYMHQYNGEKDLASVSIALRKYANSTNVLLCITNLLV